VLALWSVPLNDCGKRRQADFGGGSQNPKKKGVRAGFFGCTEGGNTYPVSMRRGETCGTKGENDSRWDLTKWKGGKSGSNSSVNADTGEED